LGFFRLKHNGLIFVIMIVATGVVCLWQARHSEWHPARRAFSALKSVDFSSRNRMDAWRGDLQIMAEHPWFGTDWNRPERLYDQYYLSPKLTEWAAIQMNDYLFLGAVVGVPALLCLAGYFWLSLSGWRQFHFTDAPLQDCQLDWLKTTCRAGAIVLLIGFWFDGGLFRFSTGATFWILLEMGREEVLMGRVKPL
jgi:hypothetical protein